MSQLIMLQSLRNNAFFSNMTDHDVGQFLHLGKIETHRAGELIVTEGDVEHFMYFIIKGSCSVTKNSKEGEKVFISQLADGEHFGEAGVFLEGPRSANVEAVTEVTVMKIKKEDLIKSIRENHQFGMEFLLHLVSELFARLRATTHELQIKRKGTLSQDSIDNFFK